MKSLEIAHFLDVVKKEIVCEDEQIAPAIYDQADVKQEYHYKEELDLAWDEGDHDLDPSKSNVLAINNSSQKSFSYPIVLVERLPHDAINNDFYTHRSDNVFETLNTKTSNEKKFLQHYGKNCDTQQLVQKKIVPMTKLHKCSNCGDEFQKLPPFLRHMQVCGRTKENISNNFAPSPNIVKGRCVHYCEKCNKTFNDDNIGSFIQKKCQTCNLKFSFKCKECNKIFASYKTANKHLKINHSLREEVLKCHQCEYKTFHIEHLTRHVVRNHSTKPHECQKCGRQFKNRENLNCHLRHSHVEQKEFQCDTCSYRGKTKENLRRHVTQVHTEGKAIECPQCNIMLKNKICLKVHLGYCKKEPSFRCDVCSFKTKYKSCLTQHNQNKHSTILLKNEKCLQCAKEFKNANSLRRHLSICGKVSESSCKYCFRVFKFKDSLEKHIIRLHQKDNSNKSAYTLPYFYCDNCTYKSKFKYDLTKHVMIHLDVYRKECPKCKKYFCQEYFKRHEKQCGRSGLRCNHCDFRTSVKDSLKNHILNMHSKGQEIDCPRCGKTFKNKSYMRIHLRHCGTDPHLQCGFCAYKTKYKHHLKKHIESKHSTSKKP